MSNRKFSKDTQRWPVQNVPLTEIQTDAKLQPRDRLHQGTIDDYAERLQEGDTFPPVVTFLINKRYVLAHGYHRLEAAKLVEEKTLRCEVRKGDYRAAVLYSVGCNAANGLRRSWADKRKVVGTMLGDAEWNKWSDSEIARQCHVSQPFVARLRDDLRPVTSNVLSDSERKYVNKNGTASVMKITAIGKRPSALPTVTLAPPPAAPVDRNAVLLEVGSIMETKREQFLAELTAFENSLKEDTYGFAFLHSHPAADLALCHRIEGLAQKLMALCRRIQRKQERA